MATKALSKKPVVSILMAAHQAMPTIRAAVVSALACKAAESGGVEIVVAPDDGSSCYEELLADIDSCVVLPPSNLLGPGPGRNRAFAASRGEWITMLDADDLVSPGYVDQLLAAASANRLPAAYSRTQYEHRGQVVRRLDDSSDWLDTSRFATFAGSIHAMFHREMWVMYPSFIAEDVYVDATILDRCGGRAPLANAMYLASLHDTSLCARTPQATFNKDYRGVLAADEGRAVLDIFASKLAIGIFYEEYVSKKRIGFHDYMNLLHGVSDPGATRAPSSIFAPA